MLIPNSFVLYYLAVVIVLHCLSIHLGSPAILGLVLSSALHCHGTHPAVAYSTYSILFSKLDTNIEVYWHCFVHKYVISEHTLKHILKYKGLFTVTVKDAVGFIRDQLEDCRQLRGDRWTYCTCKQYGLCVRKKDVHSIINELNPRGVLQRK